MEKTIIKLRYWGQYNYGSDEMFEVKMPNDKTEYIGRQTWGKFVDMYWLCDAPYGYCEHDSAVNSDDYDIVWCDKDWNDLGHEVEPWNFTVAKVKNDVINRGIVRNGTVKTDDIVRTMYKQDNHGENIIENALYCHWDRISKPTVVHKFSWAGYKCYVMRVEHVHHHYALHRTQWYIMSQRQGLPQPTIGEVCESATEEYCNKYRHERYGDKKYIFSHFRKSDRGEWYLSSTDGWSSMSFSSFPVYRAWCKKHNLCPITPDTSGMSGYGTAPFEIKELPYAITSIPADFTPYPVMSNGDPRMGGYKVEGSTVYVFRPNPNYAPVWDGIYQGVNYAKDGDDYAFRAFHRFRETHVTF